MFFCSRALLKEAYIEGLSSAGSLLTYQRCTFQIETNLSQIRISAPPEFVFDIYGYITTQGLGENASMFSLRVNPDLECQ